MGFSNETLPYDSTRFVRRSAILGIRPYVYYCYLGKRWTLLLEICPVFFTKKWQMAELCSRWWRVGRCCGVFRVGPPQRSIYPLLRFVNDLLGFEVVK